MYATAAAFETYGCQTAHVRLSFFIQLSRRERRAMARLQTSRDVTAPNA